MEKEMGENKKKILWICNTPLSEISHLVGRRDDKEGWITGILNELKKQKEVALSYMFPQKIRDRTMRIKNNGIQFYGFYSQTKNSYTASDKEEAAIKEIIEEVEPDLIHIFGTELPHTIEAVRAVKKKSRIIISVQGLVSELAKVYLDGIPLSDCFRGVYKADRYQSLILDKREYYKRGINEIEAIKSVRNIIGRTDWDKACIKRINSRCNYYYCSETLRDAFYHARWDVNCIQKRSIFVSQGDYPIKGLHHLLYSMPYIIKKFPDVQIYVAGNQTFLEDTPYGKFIKKIIEKYKLKKHLHFTGFLNEQKYCDMLIGANVMVMPSNIENSPNSVGEAMLVGTPVVAAYVGGIPSILCHGREGFLYQSQNRHMLSHYICEIFENDQTAVRVSENAKRRASLLYDRKRNVEQLMDIYRKCLKKGEGV